MGPIRFYSRVIPVVFVFLSFLPITTGAGARPAPEDARSHWKRGNDCYKRGKVERAISEYEAAIGLNPGFAEAHFNLAVALDHQNQPDAAIHQYREAIGLAPSNALAHNNLAVLLYRQGKLAAAIREYREAIQLEPMNAMAHNNLGSALAAEGQREAAMAQYRDAIGIDPGYAHAHNVFVGNEDARYMGGLVTPLPSGAEITIWPAVSAGWILAAGRGFPRQRWSASQVRH